MKHLFFSKMFDFTSWFFEEKTFLREEHLGDMIIPAHFKITSSVIDT